MLVRKFMTIPVATLAETDSLLDASLHFERKTYRHIPVVRGKRVVGIITGHDSE